MAGETPLQKVDPALQQTQPSQKMYIDLSGRGGLGPRWFGDEGDTFAQHPEYRYIGTLDQKTATLGQTTASDMAAGIWNPSRRYGYMSPSNNSFTTVIDGQSGRNFSAEIRSAVYDPASGYAYYAENGIHLWQNSAITGVTWTENSQLSGGVLDSVVRNFTDTAIYSINGTKYLFASYQNQSVSPFGDILIMPPGASVSGLNATWLSGTAAGAFNLGYNDHFLVVSDYYMYVGEQNYIHRIDGSTLTGGTNGTALAQVLVAPLNINFTDGVTWNGNLWLATVEITNPSGTPSNQPNGATYDSNRCGVFVWDEDVTTINQIQYIVLEGVQTICKLFVTQSGKMRALVVSSKRTVQIREYNGVTFDVIEEAASISWPKYRRSVRVAGDTVIWIGQDGKIYSYGFVTWGEDEQLNIIGDGINAFTAGHSISLGATLWLDNNNSSTSTRSALLISGYDNTSSAPYNYIWYPNTVGNTPNIGNVFSMVKYFPQLVKVNYARVYHHVGTVSNAATVQGTLNIYLNQSNMSPLTYSITQQDIAKGFKYCPINQGAKNAVFGLQAEVQWATATTTADSTDWLPRLLEIDYTPIEKLM